MRFMRILTDINLVRSRLSVWLFHHRQHGQCHRLLKKSREGIPAVERLASPVFELFRIKTIYAHGEVERPKSPVVDFEPLTNTDPTLTREKNHAGISEEKSRRSTTARRGELPVRMRRVGRDALLRVEADRQAGPITSKALTTRFIVRPSSHTG
jgi:hypothetical protein